MDIRSRIREIIAGGRTGIWSSDANVCSRRRDHRVEIMWHFPDAGAESVVVFLVGSTGKERTFANGQATGLKETGPWVREGMAFVAKSTPDGRELGTVVIGGRDCD